MFTYPELIQLKDILRRDAMANDEAATLLCKVNTMLLSGSSFGVQVRALRFRQDHNKTQAIKIVRRVTNEGLQWSKERVENGDLFMVPEIALSYMAEELPKYGYYLD